MFQLLILYTSLLASLNITSQSYLLPTHNRVGSGASIQISTANAVPLYKDIHSATALDWFFGQHFAPRDILSEPYFSFVKDVHFNTLQYSGGSTSDYDHVVIGDTKVTGGKGDGYNVSAEDCKQRNDNINTALDGVGAAHFGKDFFNEYCALLNKLGIQGDVNANVQGGTLDELMWKIQQAHAKRVVFGLEQVIQSNGYDYPDGNAYKKKITAWVEAVKKKYPEVTTVLDAAPLYRVGDRFSAWNNAIAGMPGDAVRTYLWDKDAVDWTTDYNQNLTRMNEAFTTTFPKWMSAIKNQFPDKKVAVWQWGIKAKSEVSQTMLGSIYIGKFYKFVIDYNKANSNYISYASFYTLKSLDRGNGKISNNYQALKTCGMLFNGNKRLLDITINGVSGVSGVACDEAGRHTLLLINESGSEVSISTISIDNNSSGARQFTITSEFSESLSSKIVSTETKTVSSLSLKPYSVNVVEF